MGRVIIHSRNSFWINVLAVKDSEVICQLRIFAFHAGILKQLIRPKFGAKTSFANALFRIKMHIKADINARVFKRKCVMVAHPELKLI